MTNPNTRVILPAEATEEMMLSGMASAERMATATQGDAIIDGYSSMVASSPSSGRVTAEMLEAAARAICFADGQIDWPLDDDDREDFRRMARAALSALGREVEG